MNLVQRILASLGLLSVTVRQRLDAQDVVLQSISDKLDEVLEILDPGPAISVTFTAFLDDGTIKQGATNITMRDDQQLTLTPNFADKKGKTSTVDGVPVWAGSDDTVITVVPAADGLSATVAGVAPGSARVTMTADADPGTGVTPVTGIFDVTITAGNTATITLTASDPVDQP